MAGHTLNKKTCLYLCPYMWHSLKLTASLHLKIDGWKTILTFRDAIHFQVRTVSFREGTLPKTNSSPLKIGRPKRKLVSQPSIFKCYVSFREGTFVQRPSRRFANLNSDVSPSRKTSNHQKHQKRKGGYYLPGDSL